MKPHSLVLALALVLCVLLGAPRTEAAGEIVMVVHARNAQALKADDVKRFYMGETGYWSNNTPVHLTIRTPGSPASDGFFRAIHVSPVRFRRLWQERQLSGQGTVPETLPTSAAMLARVAADPGAVGFATAEEVGATAPGVRIIPLQ